MPPALPKRNATSLDGSWFDAITTAFVPRNLPAVLAAASSREYSSRRYSEIRRGMHSLSVCGREFEASTFELPPQFTKVLHDAVVYDRDLPVGIDKGVRVLVRWSAVCRPPGVTDADYSRPGDVLSATPAASRACPQPCGPK